MPKPICFARTTSDMLLIFKSRSVILFDKKYNSTINQYLKKYFFNHFLAITAIVIANLRLLKRLPYQFLAIFRR
jgi:hypothetical protein